MAIDAPSIELSEISSNTPTAIDFSSSPDEIQPYKFGDPINRKNFTGFILDSFAKSRGSLGTQAMYLKYLEPSQPVPMNLLLEGFIDAGGYEALSPDEQAKIKDAFERVKAHGTNIDVQKTMKEVDFDELFLTDMTSLLTILECPGQKVKLGNKRYIVGEFDQTILSLDRDGFLHWLTTRAKDYKLIREIKTEEESEI